MLPSTRLIDLWIHRQKHSMRMFAVPLRFRLTLFRVRNPPGLAPLIPINPVVLPTPIARNTHLLETDLLASIQTGRPIESNPL